MDYVFGRLGIVLYYHHVQFYILKKGGNVLVGVIPNVHSFRDLVLDNFVVIIKYMIITEIFLRSLGQGIQEFKNIRRPIVNL